MKTGKVEPQRTKTLNQNEIRKGKYVLYWMQQSQREEFNHALEYAADQANELGRPLVVGFGLMDDYPDANRRHYSFMLEGLAETKEKLSRRDIKLVVRRGNPPGVALSLSDDASLVVCDRGYLNHQEEWRSEVARKAGCKVVQVESDVVVPVEVVSDKAEYAARTIRPKIWKHVKDYLKKPARVKPAKSSMNLRLEGLDVSRADRVLNGLGLKDGLPEVGDLFEGGTSQAKMLFRTFVKDGLERYAENSNRPETDDISHMSMYLHFGQISPLYLALRVLEKADSSHPLKRAEKSAGRSKKPGGSSAGSVFSEAVEAYLEELIVRRELAVNFVHYNSKYASYGCLPDWAKKTLREHSSDQRSHRYTRRQLEDARTHDAYWNAAMTEMKVTGFMHNYMRMYWGKKVLEWSNTPQHAFRTLLYLNNKYFLDGRDPNSFVGVAWVFGLHDRPWQERPVFGKIRYMSASGLERKCDIDAYVRKVEKLAAR
jgi:deoxyribodipyrimidine photo-lyase